jgi:hypothetical protein
LNTDPNELVKTIESMMAALARGDRERVDELLCADFHAFENGVHVGGRELLDLMSTYHAQGRRYRWSVTSPQIEIQGNLGAVVYLNVGSIADAPGTEPMPMAWLETVLLRRQSEGWRVAFIHSTRTQATPDAAEAAR